MPLHSTTAAVPAFGESGLDLLTEPLLAVEGAPALSMSGVLAALSGGQPLVFTHLRPHQQAAWHAFLVQLAYLALERADEATPPTDPAAWAGLLLTLADGQASAWHLCVDDWQQPAFLQPPCSPGRETDFKATADSAQALDLLVTSRNFDEKAAKVAGFEPESADAWVYSLVTLQTSVPYTGSGNYGSMRMNGGWASRPQFRLAFQRGSGCEFQRDVGILLHHAPALKGEPDGIGSGRALPLLWLETWDGAAMSIVDVHPLALEVCRRVRLRRSGSGFAMLRATSQARRVAADEMNGAVHDPWIPLSLRSEQVSAFNAQKNGFAYFRFANVLLNSSAYKLPLLARPSSTEVAAGRPATLIASALPYGKRGTEGMLYREVYMPMPVLRAVADGDARLAERARAFVDLAGKAGGQVLRPALIQFIDGSDDVDWKHPDPARMAAPWLARLEAEIDACFFGTLFDTCWRRLKFDPPVRALPTQI